MGRHDRGVKQAGFLVLYKTTMPSVLIETGFLTNPKEEKFLSDKATQEKMSAAMFTAFRKYKNELEGIDEQIETDYSKIGGNGSQNDVDKTDEPEQVEDIKKDDIVFRVQVETSSQPIPLSSSRFKGYKVYQYHQNGLYKYTTGVFVNDFESANAMKSELRSGDFQHAFVVAFRNGERIDLQKAIKLAEK